MNKIQILGILMIAGLLASGCAAARAPEMAADRSWSDTVSNEAAVQYDAAMAGYKGETGEEYAQETGSTESLVIRNANLSIVVKDPAESSDRIQSLAEELGGFVVSSNVYQTTYGISDAKTVSASMTIRVPADRLDEALERIEEEAIEVTSKQVTGEDVTKEYTDLASKLRNLEAAEEQLRKIMDSSTKTEDVLATFRELSSVREQIEITKGQMQYYEDSARLSMINVDLIPDVLSRPLQIAGWRPEGTAKDALEALIAALQFIGKAVIWLGICVLPILVIFGVPAYFATRAIVRKRRQNKAQKVEKDQKQE
jgi:phosphoribosyl-ATP pyrophosphohydrolase